MTFNLSGHSDVICCPKLVVIRSSVLIKNKGSWGPPGDLESVDLGWVLGIFLNKNTEKFLDASKFGPVFKYLLLNSPRGSEGTYFILYKKFSHKTY